MRALHCTLIHNIEQRALKYRKKEEKKWKKTEMFEHVLFLMLNAPMGSESCEGEEVAMLCVFLEMGECVEEKLNADRDDNDS